MDTASDLQERALAARSAGRLEEAETCYRRLLALRGPHPGLLNNLGVILAAQRRHVEAIALFEQSLRARPLHFNTLVALANALNFSNRPDEAIAHCRAILAIDPHHVDARHNLVVGLRALNRHRDAIAELAVLLAQDPADADAQYNLALSAFAIGDYAAAGRHYEARWRGTAPQPPLPHPEVPLWQPGEDLRAMRLLVLAEQGLGDTLQFIRFVPRLAQQCIEVNLQVQPPLVAFLRRHLPAQHVGALGDEIRRDSALRRAALLSLPLVMRLADPSDWASRGAYLHADPARTAVWCSRMPPATRRVGVTWRGSPGHRNDHNRSLPLQAISPWLDAMAAADVAVVALQKDVTPEERTWLGAYAHVQVLATELADFDDTAAVLAALDHVVAVDTSVAHLAGGMARPATLLLPYAPDWRWGVEGNESMLYPGMRLLRQRAIGDWTSVIGDLIAGTARL